MDFAAMFIKLITKNGLVAAFIIIGITTWIAYKIGGLTKGRIHGSAIAIFFGLILAYIGGVVGAGVATFVVGPVTGASLGASSEVIAISIAAGVVKSVLVMILTPFVAKFVGLDNPQSAMIYGGLMGTTSGTAAGMAAVDPKLVPYAAMTATFYTGSGCLVFPSILYFATKAIFG